MHRFPRIAFGGTAVAVDFFWVFHTGPTIATTAAPVAQTDHVHRVKTMVVRDVFTDFGRDGRFTNAGWTMNGDASVDGRMHQQFVDVLRF